MRTIDETEALQAAPRHDTELTLGSGTLLLMFFGLVLLCGLCFGVGYSMGHRGIQDGSEAANFASDASALLHGKGTSKPAAAAPQPVLQPVSAAPALPAPQPAEIPTSQVPNPTPTVQTQAPQPVAASAPKADAEPPVIVKAALTKPTTAATANAAAPPIVKPAVLPIPKPQAAAPAKPAAAASGPIMVQIAAVSLDEDADVLVAALRKRSYAVVSGRDPADGLIHVRIGPFKTREEADNWREKLLNDGYNAIIQP